jgi:2-methylcitrate dehydratase
MFRTLAGGVLSDAEIERFLDLAERLPELTPAEVRELTIVAAPGVLDTVAAPTGLFELGRA